MYATGRSRALAAGVLATAALGFTVAQATAATTAQVQNGTLFISGTNGADDITLQLQPGNPNVLEVDINGDGAGDLSFDRSTFTAIDVQARGGDDRVTNRGQFFDEVTTVDGGSGHDTLAGNLGDQTLIGGSGNDSVSGGDGDDTVRLGTGNDRFTWNPGDDNDVVEGEAGADVLDFNGSAAAETIDVSANGPRVRLLRNIANVVTDLGGVERVEIDALAGSDTLVAGDTAGTELQTFAVNLNGFNGAGDTVPDSVIAGGTPKDDSIELGNQGAAQTVSGATTGGGGDRRRGPRRDQRRDRRRRRHRHHERRGDRHGAVRRRRRRRRRHPELHGHRRRRPDRRHRQRHQAPDRRPGLGAARHDRRERPRPGASAATTR